ncbi:hypothetical protein [Marinicella meishanensis]|uniref:hypothetical protein n=1 Tax=Marinicella meishanensis TaxID=2873263 RepID=UPI001CBE47C4|nr:hypothetical protein [Marinicella sp. NBU2979]
MIAAGLSLGQAQVNGTAKIERHVIANGGGQSAGGSVAVTGTIAQPAANQLSTAGPYALQGGFWSEHMISDVIFKTGFGP